MKFDEQDVERAAPRVWAEDYYFCHGAYPDEADPPVRWEDVPEAIRVHARALSRVALGAMEREPTRNPHTGLTVEEAWLEIADDMRDVLIERQHELDDQANTSRQLPYATLSGVWVSWDSYYVPDYGCYEAETVEAELNEASEAIRNAVAAAKGGE